MIEFLEMGGYAKFVWPCYAMVFVLLIWNVAAPLRRHSQLLNDARRNLRREKMMKESDQS